MHIAALVLAAGRSSRFGEGNKLLADLCGKPVLSQTLAAVTTAGFDRIWLVTGSSDDAVAQLAQTFAVEVVRCSDAHDGMGRSIAAGVAALPSGVDGLIILPGDMPLITARTLQILVETFSRNDARMIVHAATHDGAQRNPVIWPRPYFAQLATLQGDRGAKSLIADAIAVPVGDSTELLDVDDLAALAQARAILSVRHAQS